MLARWIRGWDKAVLEPFLLFFARCGITPNTLTITGLAALVASGFAVACGHLVLGGCLLLAGGFLDGFDGALARHLKEATQFGAFLDSLCDHCGDLALYLGLLYFSPGGHPRMDAILIVVALFGSLFGSQVRSRASMLGVDVAQVGMFTRCERVLVLAAGLFTHSPTAALWVLAVFNNLSALQRVIHAVRRASPGAHPNRAIEICSHQ